MTERMTNADQLRALRKFSEGQLRWDEVEALTEALRALEQEPTLKQQLVESDTSASGWARSYADVLNKLEQAEAELARLRADLQAKK